MDFFTLKNSNGMQAVISDLGGVLTELHVPDRSGTFRDVVLGYADRKDYMENPYHFGAVIGRYANRIKGGRFKIDGREYRLPRNNASGDCQHGGIRGFHLHIFEVSTLSENSITLRRISPDGEEGFPGALLLEVTYSLTGDNTLRMGYRAECDSPTILNPTNHSYFNLNGNNSGSVGTHFISVSASRMLECGESGIPTGRILDVAGTPFDLRKECLLSKRLNAELPELKSAGGFDVIYLPDNSRGAAIVYAPESGIEMKLSTTEPAIGFYTGNHLDGRLAGKSGHNYRPHDGLCLEAEHCPDSPNHPAFPTTLLRPGEVYTQITDHSFGVRNVPHFQS